MDEMSEALPRKHSRMGRKKQRAMKILLILYLPSPPPSQAHLPAFQAFQIPDPVSHCLEGLLSFGVQLK